MELLSFAQTLTAMRVHNIDSRVSVPDLLWDLAARRLTYLQTPLHQVPIYLVSPKTIDKFHIPQTSGSNRKCLAIARKTLREKLKDFNPESTSISDLVDKIYKDCERKVILLALYLPDISTSLSSFPSPPPTSSGPAILVCAERILRKNNGELLIQKVLIHELVHAYRGVEGWRPWGKVWRRHIEESLANAIAFVHFTPKERSILAAFMARQPAEYAAYTFWLKWKSREEFHTLLKGWRRGPASWPSHIAWLFSRYDPEVVEEFLWRLRHYRYRYVYESWLASHLLYHQEIWPFLALKALSQRVEYPKIEYMLREKGIKETYQEGLALLADEILGEVVET